MRPHVAPKGRPRPCLLVIESIEIMRSALTCFLEAGGYDVEAAASAEEALQLSQLVRWDGVVMDLDLPKGHGVNLYVHILRNGGGRRLPALFLTGRLDQALNFGLQSAPWTRLMQKPCNSRQILAALEECLRVAGQPSPLAGDRANPGD